MWRDNLTWGQKRIAAELAKLGYRISPRTVARYRPPGLVCVRTRGQRWTTFVRNHLEHTWAGDFFTVVTARFKVLYVFVVLSLRRRRLVHVGVTAHPSSAWAAQRVVEAVVDAEDVPQLMIHDRDSIFSDSFRNRVRGLGTRPLATPPRSPQANAFCERVNETLRRDCLDHVILRNERHAERILGRVPRLPPRSTSSGPPDAAELHRIER
jgi:transposase InsO family protein